MPMAPKRILHVFNYGWPAIDGYTVRSMGIVTAQRRYLGLDVSVAVSPFPPLNPAADRTFMTDTWGPASQIHLGAPAAPGRLRLANLEKPDLGLSPRSSVLYRRHLALALDAFQPDLVHVHHPHYVGRIALRLARERAIPGVYEIRCFNGDYDLDTRHPYYRLRGNLHNYLERQTCRRASVVVTISQGLADRIAVAGVPRERVFVVRNSVDMDLFTGDGKPPRDPTVFSIGYATTFNRIEGLDVLVQGVAWALQKLREQGRELKVTLAGIGSDWQRIRDLVESLGLEETVRMPGFLPYSAMPDFYRGLDLFVVPRTHTTVSADTTPLKPLEALAAGVPVLASDLPALRELLAGRRGVRFFEPRPEVLAAALEQCAEDPPGVAPDISDRSWKLEVSRYLEVYAAAARLASDPARGRAGR